MFDSFCPWGGGGGGGGGGGICKKQKNGKKKIPPHHPPLVVVHNNNNNRSKKVSLLEVTKRSLHQADWTMGGKCCCVCPVASLFFSFFSPP